MTGEDDGFYLEDGILQKDTSTCPLMLLPAKRTDKWLTLASIHSSPPVRLTPEAQRGLILISKILQQLSNGTEFGVKEE